MDLAVHDQILWRACELAHQRNLSMPDPRTYFLLLVRGSWINDVNQSTLFTDQLNSIKTPALHKLLYSCWVAYHENLAAQMSLDPAKAPLASKAVTELAKVPADHIDDFGSYSRFDHLDVSFETDILKEFPPELHSRVSETIRETRRLIAFKLSLARNSVPTRFNWSSISLLGQALHTVADFYAHTNYVELLLWELANISPPIGLDQTIRLTFNARKYDRSRPWRTICPLPEVGAEGDYLQDGGGLMYYGVSPKETPLMSTVFEMDDTVCTLLSMYEQHLVKMDSWHSLGTGPSESDHLKRDAYLDGAMALLDLSDNFKRTLGFDYHVAELIDEQVKQIGRRTREWLANALERRSSEAGSDAVRSALCISAKVVRSYDSKEAADWRNAGFCKFVIQSLSNDMLWRVKKAQSERRCCLPHHTLLRKDNEQDTPHSLIRFNLACTLAVELTAQLIGWYFADTQMAQDPCNILNLWLGHPCDQKRTEVQSQNLSQLVAHLNGPPWTSVSHLSSLSVCSS